MSKIAFVGSPAYGHTNPTLPVVQELVERGEQVVYYNHEEFRKPIEQTGAAFRPYPETEISSTQISTAIQGGSLANIAGLLLGATTQLLPYLLDELPRQQPDLVLFDSIALWGKMAATLLGLRDGASISHFLFDAKHLISEDSHSLRYLREVFPKLPRIIVARLRLSRRYKGAVPRSGPLLPVLGGVNIVYTARDLQPDASLIDETFRFVGPSIRQQARDADFPFEALAQGRVVYISLGTVHHTHTDFYRRCFAAFADFPAQFVLSTGRGVDGQPLGAIPSNFIVRPTVPQLALLQHTDVFITHGGMNSIHEGLYFGVPLIVIPHQIEQLMNARCVQKQGAGLVLDRQLAGKGLTSAELRQALEKVLSVADYREAAAKVQQTLRATGGYRQAADEIQAYLDQSTPSH